MSAYPNLFPASTTDVWILLIGTLLALLSISITIISGTTMRRGKLTRAIIELIVDVIIFHAVFDAATAVVKHREPVSVMGRIVRNFDSPLELTTILVLLGIVMIRLVNVMRLSSNSITIFAVGKALDDMPQGVLFSGMNGEVLQTNTTMEELNCVITDLPLTNGARFWEIIQNGEVKEGVHYRGGEKPILRMPDGKSWVFSCERRRSKLGSFYQILATEATEEQAMAGEIDTNVERLSKMNHRLRDYNHIVDETIRSEELLATKKRVHDDMGTTLLAAKMLIVNQEGPATPEEVYRQWREDLILMREEAKEHEKEKDPFQRFREAANYLGLELQIMGDLPRSYTVADLICVGIQECMTNALQHAKATQMYVTVKEEADEYIATYSNNGAEVKLPINEGVGLSLLRTQAQNVGATMEYLPGQHFVLRLRIPKIS